jgi:ATP phosphoribosyltransferase regulatory subunit
MINSKTHLPPGTQDYLPEECAHKREIEDKARRCLSSWGYDEIETPCMEYMDVFRGSVGDFEQERMFKFSDSSGRLLALRPDITMPLARVAATRLSDRLPLRMFYIGNAFQFSGAEATAGMREFTQIGMELMGQPGPMADAEVIALAITVLRAAGLRDFQIDIGQVQFFKGLMQEAGLSDTQAEEARRLVEDKNMLAIEMLMQGAGISGSLRNRIMELPALYGGPEVLAAAERFTANKVCRGALDYMKQTLDALANYNLDEYISVDLGMVQSINYYSGIIFRGISKYLGHQLLAGGRYDGLVEEFGRRLPATGFAFSLKPVLIALERQGGLVGGYPIDAIVCFQAQDGSAPLQALECLRAAGKRIEQFYGSCGDLAAYAESRSAGSALCWSGSAFRNVWTRGGGVCD